MLGRGHLATEADTGRIVASVMTDRDADDGSQVGPLLGQIDGSVASVTGDGAYDRDDVYAEVAARHPEAAVVVPPRANAVPSDVGYDEAVVTELPDSAVEAFAGVGNPFSMGAFKPGERVVDLGSGGGFDCFVAARQVGAQGRVVGIDMTEEMLARSRMAAAT